MKKILINKYFLFASCVVAAWLFYISLHVKPGAPIAPPKALSHDVGFVSAENNSKIFYEVAIQKTEVADNSQPVDELNEYLEGDNNIKSYLRRFSSELMMAIDLQEKFDSDEMDPATATDAEKELAYTFYQGMQWQEFIPQEISCKKNSCRVTLPVLTPEKNAQLMELISEQMMANKIHFIYAIPVSLPVEGKELIYFIRKNSLITSPGVLP